MAVISVILSLICTFGFLFHLGVPFNPVCSTMPFLILAVGNAWKPFMLTFWLFLLFQFAQELTHQYMLGVDDAFLMLGAWRTTDRRLTVAERMAFTMSDAGLSITVTSVTDFGCFGKFLSYFWLKKEKKKIISCVIRLKKNGRAKCFPLFSLWSVHWSDRQYRQRSSLSHSNHHSDQATPHKGVNRIVWGKCSPLLRL